MALKGKRTPLKEMYGVAAAVVEAGSAVVYSTQSGATGTGDGHNEKAPLVGVYAGATPVGTKFAGIAQDDVVNVDLSVTPRYALKDTDRVLNETFLIGEWGEWQTNKVTGSPVAGDIAYLTAGSCFGPTQVGVIPAVGVFKTAKDADGYATILIQK